MISYGKNSKKRQVISIRKTPGLKRLCIIIVAVIFICALYIGAQNGSLSRILLPGDPEITEAAISTLIENLQDGKTVADAVEVFCKEIISNAQIAQ